MTGNLYATITKAAILSAGLMGTAYAKDAAPEDFFNPTITIVDADGKPLQKPVVSQNGKVDFKYTIDLKPEQNSAPFPKIVYAPVVCVYEESAVSDGKVKEDANPLGCETLEEKTFNSVKELEGIEYSAVAFTNTSAPAAESDSQTLQGIGFKPGDYLLVARGKIGGTLGYEGSKAEFTVEAEAVAANQNTAAKEFMKQQANGLLEFYYLVPLEVRAGRYGANWQLPKSSDQYLEGFTYVDGKLVLDITNFSHNFELRVDQTEDFAEKAKAFAKQKGVVYKNPQEALFAVNARVQNLNDMDADRDLDIWTELEPITELPITELQFSYPKLSRQSYEVKQHARLHGKDGVGRTHDQRSLETPAPLPFAGVDLTDLLKMNNDPDTFYVIKVAFDDIDPEIPDGKYTDGKDTIIGIDAFEVDIDNKAPNSWAVGIPAYIGGVLTGFGIRSALGLGDDDGSIDGLTPPENTDEPCPEESTGTFSDGDSGTGVERRRK